MADFNLKSDFVIDTGSRCFLCLQLGRSSAELESEGEVNDLQLTSFQYFSRYLKMNIGKIFTEKLTIAMDLCNKVEKSVLKVRLCEDCKVVMEKFSTLGALFEKIEMEIVCCLKVIFDKINVGNSNTLEELRNGRDNGDLGQEKLKIAMTVRKIAAEKCARRIQTDLPRVKISSLKISKHLLEANRKSIAATNHVRDDELSPRSPMSISGSIISVDDNLTIGSENDSGNVALQISDGEPPEPQPPDARMESSEQFSENCETHSEPDSEVQVIPEEDIDGRDEQTPSGNEVGGSEPVFGPCGAGMSYFVPANGMYRCTSCTKEFCSKLESVFHYKAIHLSYQFKCEYCRFACFSAEEDLNEHWETCPNKLTSSTENNQHVCKICQKRFKKTKLLSAHIKHTHSGQRKFACEMCEWKFKYKIHLKRHMSTVHVKKKAS